MSNLIKTAQQKIKDLISESVSAAVKSGSLPEGALANFTVEIPGDLSHGDFASNVAMVSAKTFRMSPRAIAEVIVDNLDLGNSYFEECTIAGPGFLNFKLDSCWFSNVLREILSQGKDYGRTSFGEGEKVMIEFVSANPTGPMHMGNARGGALGDCLASAMQWAGFEVTREFYVNDAGNQIEKFGYSLEARYLQIYKGEDAVPFPEDGYHGEDITMRAKQFADEFGDSLLNAASEDRRLKLIDFALPKNIAKLREDLERYRIDYDVWFHEKNVHDGGDIDKIIGILQRKGLTYESDGALWYKATEYGSEKDEVLIRGNGHPTYFAADIAYHYNKFVTRKFDRVINVWGADHHGHVARLKGAMNAIDLDGDKLDIILMQLVRLTRDGEIVRMSKRTGKAITLIDLLDEVPVDAARFLFNMREPTSQMEFDLGLAVEQSTQNPVYYVQYAHARICSILRNMTAVGVDTENIDLGGFSQLSTAEEIELIRGLAMFPAEIEAAAANYDPARITRYIVDLAGLFHKFYNNCRVHDPENSALTNARLGLCIGTRTVINNALTMLKIDAPTSM